MGMLIPHHNLLLRIYDLLIMPTNENSVTIRRDAYTEFSRQRSNEGEIVFINFDGKDYVLKILEEDSPMGYQEKYAHLKLRGCPVPEELFLVRIDDEQGKLVVCLTDLRERGKYEVVSTNSPLIQTAAFRELVSRMTLESKEKLRSELLVACFNASRYPVKDQNGNFVPRYWLRHNAHFLAINNDDPNDFKYCVGDFGRDVTGSANLFETTMSAGGFYLTMTGEVLQIPDSLNYHNSASDWNTQLTEQAEQIRRSFDWLKRTE